MTYGSGIILLQVMVEVMEHRLNLLKRKEEVLLKGQVTHLLKRGRLQQLGGITMAPLVMKGEDIGITLRRRGAKLQEEDHTIRYMYLQGDNKLTDQQKNIPAMKEELAIDSTPAVILITSLDRLQITGVTEAKLLLKCMSGTGMLILPVRRGEGIGILILPPQEGISINLLRPVEWTGACINLPVMKGEVADHRTYRQQVRRN